MLGNKYHIWEVIHSPSKTKFFQWIPAWSLAPINIVFMNKEKIVHIPSQWCTCEFCSTLLDILSPYLVQIYILKDPHLFLSLISSVLMWKIKHLKSLSNLLLGIQCQFLLMSLMILIFVNHWIFGSYIRLWISSIHSPWSQTSSSSLVDQMLISS